MLEAFHGTPVENKRIVFKSETKIRMIDGANVPELNDLSPSIGLKNSTHLKK